jgi:subtilisin family serine protease
MRFLGGAAAIVAALVLPAAALGQADPLRPQQWGLDMIEADAAHGVTRGAGAVVAVVDSGVLASHADLAGRLLGGRDFVGGDATPNDENGHGTHATGIVVANARNGVGVSSVAPGATVLPLRVLGADGSGTVDDVVAGIDYASTHGADVINLSLGEDVPIGGTSSEFSEAIDRALDRGVIVVAASGNNGLPVCEQPSGRGRLLCVGSVDRRSMRSFFSSFGQGLGLVAPGGSGLPVPGEDVLSTAGDGGYEEMAGTSQAAPHVAGVAALLVSRGVRGQAAANRILATARDAGPPGPDPEYGAGIVNARAAVSGLPSPGASAPLVPGRCAVARRQRIRSVLRRGIRMRCRPRVGGRLRSAATRRRRRVAAGSRRARAGTTTTFYARPTRAGRRMLRRSLRRRRSVAVRLRVRMPGARAQAYRVRLRP